MQGKPKTLQEKRTMEKPKILIVDDDESVRTHMKWALIQDYEVCLAPDVPRAMEFFNTKSPQLVTLDLGLPPEPHNTTGGLGLLEKILYTDPLAKVIVITGNADRSAALEAVSLGAHDFFIKPINIDELKMILKRAFYVRTLEEEYTSLQKKLGQSEFSEIVGTSAGMEHVFDTVRKVSTTDVPVLVTGESGTGKELLARAIHSNSVRCEGPFIPINCGAIPENLLESELFGHEKGSFTGAHISRRGRFELAHGGSLFLDEIGELPAPLQVKLLRFLQDYMIERVGGRERIETDVRVIAATNRDIGKLITEDLFREDLYYRLAVVTINLPPLRERGQDVELLAREFLRKYSYENGQSKRLGEDAVMALNSYRWPGNIRELENRIRRGIALTDGPVITSDDLGFRKDEGEGGESLDLRKAREEVEKKLIKKAVLKNRGNITRAAVALGLTRPTLHHLIKKYGIQKNN